MYMTIVHVVSVFNPKHIFDVMLQVCVPFIIILSQGEGNHGYDVLLHNFKTQTTASKELAEYIKER